jgi:Tfp pilus assembly protein PilV
MRNSKKIAAFTLSEVLIVLVVTSIVVAIAFTVLRLVTKQYNAINMRYQERTEIQKLKQRMTTDFDSAKSIFWDYLEEKLQINKGNEDLVNYEWTDNFLLRNTDTLSKHIAELKLFYRGDEVVKGQIDGIDIELKRSGQIINLFVSKKLDSRQQLSDLWD